MKILVVSNGYPPRGGFGTEFYTREMVRGLNRRGHVVSVMHPVRSGGRPRYALELVHEEGVPVFLLHNPGDPSKRFVTSYRDEGVEAAFAELLGQEKPEVVHFTYLLWGLSLRLPEVARALSIPSVATLTDYGLLCHRAQMFDARLERCGGPHPPGRCARCIRTPLASDHGPLTRVLRGLAAESLALFGGLGRVPVTADLERREEEVRRAWAALSRGIAPTRSLMEHFVRAGVPREKLSHLVYSFDETTYHALPKRETGGPVRFGFLGQFAPHKGLACLLEAVRELEGLAPEPGWELVLYGQASAGRHRRYGQELLATLGSGRVRREKPFGPDQAPEILAGLTALVVPSEWDENAPLAVLQARAMGLPVIGTDVPGIAEVVRVPSQGRLVPVGDERALARAMHCVLTGELRGPIQAGLECSLDEHLEELERLYAEVQGAREVALG